MSLAIGVVMCLSIYALKQLKTILEWNIECGDHRPPHKTWDKRNIEIMKWLDEQIGPTER